MIWQATKSQRYIFLTGGSVNLLCVKVMVWLSWLACRSRSTGWAINKGKLLAAVYFRNGVLKSHTGNIYKIQLQQKAFPCNNLSFLLRTRNIKWCDQKWNGDLCWKKSEYKNAGPGCRSYFRWHNFSLGLTQAKKQNKKKTLKMTNLQNSKRSSFKWQWKFVILRFPENFFASKLWTSVNISYWQENYSCLTTGTKWHCPFSVWRANPAQKSSTSKTEGLFSLVCPFPPIILPSEIPH